MDDIKNLVETQFPFPIAYRYREMANERDRLRRFFLLIDTYEAVVRYSALVVISDYLRGKVVSPDVDARLKAIFSKEISLGDLVELLRETLRVYEQKRDAIFVPELYEFYFTDFARSNFGKQAKEFERYVNLRNEAKGHRPVTLTHEEADKLYQTWLSPLEGLLGELECFSRYDLVVPISVKRDKIIEANICQGAHPLFRFEMDYNLPLTVQGVVPEESLLLIDRNDRQRQLLLYPFFVFRLPAKVYLYAGSRCKHDTLVQVSFSDLAQGEQIIIRRSSSEEQIIIDLEQRLARVGPIGVPLIDRPASHDIAYRPYLERIIDKFGRLSELFIPLTLTSAQRQTEASEVLKFDLSLVEWNLERPFETRQTEKERGALFQMSEKYPKLVVLGEPGAGKSTSLMMLLLEKAKQALNQQGAPIPVLVTLNRYEPTESHRLLSLLVHEIEVLDSIEQLQRELSSGRFLLLLDGLNEVATEHQRSLINELQELMEEYPDNRWIITSRKANYKNEIQRNGTKVRALHKMELEPLTESQIGEFLHRYLDRILGSKKVDEIAQLIRWDNRLFELGKNPLMLTMIASVCRQEGKIPKNRGKLFEAFVNGIFQREEQVLKHTPQIDREIKREALALVAFKMTEAGKVSADKSAVRSWIHERLTELHEPQISPTLLYWEVVNNGLLVEDDGGQVVRFWHQAMQAYFGAVELDNYILRIEPYIGAGSCIPTSIPEKILNISKTHTL